MSPLALTEAGSFASSVPGTVIDLVWLVPALPLAGFAFLILFGSSLETDRPAAVGAGPSDPEPTGDSRLAGWIATSLVTTSFLVSLGVLAELLRQPVETRQVLVELFTWLRVGGLELTTDLLVDPLSVTMILVVTGIGALIHLYSIGYMHGETHQSRYFAYLNLFVFSMLVLVLAANYVVLFIGWELVGLCSYLLIGFWFTDIVNAVAAKKAFIVNRVGDVAFSIGLFTIFGVFGSLSFQTVLGEASGVLGGDTATATAIGLLLLGGAVAKSAQIPLYVWLPDAMAGPTPVSALIHAATMVTAGVYVIARSSFVYVQSGLALDVVAVIGVATALLAALIAVQQDDIKKVLAYSTVSQLGYMFVGVGVGAFGAGIFHLVTHAFFKGLLFLAAGSVMHAVADRTDMWKMGGLRRAMPVTFATSVVAVLAISGIWPFSGFFSKDQILASAYEHGHTVIWLVGLVTAGLTAFYMARWLILPFFGERRYETEIDEDVHPHESPTSMTVPLVVLAVAAFAGGWLNPSHGGPLERWLEPSVAAVEEAGGGGAVLSETLLIALSLVVGVAGIVTAWFVYRDAGTRDPLPEQLGALASGMRATFYVDDVYEWVFVTGGGAVSRALVWVDEKLIDGAVDGAAAVTRRTARNVARSQGGLVRGYVAALVFGTVVLIAAYLTGVG